MMDSERIKDGRSGQIDRGDRISSLPESILAHILSFLPTRNAVATSILSSEWKFLWTHVPVIDVEVPVIDDRDEIVCFNDSGKRVHFQCFVNNLLLLNKDPCLRFCRLTIPPEIESRYANAWIEAIAAREVKEMHLKILKNLEFPSCVFTCENLEILTLSTNGMLNGPTAVHLPNLRIINLIRFHIYEGSLLSLLTSSCPSLRELVIDRCTFCVRETNLYLWSTTLRKLQITNIYGVSGPVAVIDAPSLEYLTIFDYSMFRYDIAALPRLREADISVDGFWSFRHSKFREKALKLVNSVASSPTLRLRRSKFRGVQDFIYHGLPTFNNLTCLELEMCGSCCCFVPVILGRTPNLVRLIVKSGLCATVMDDCERSHVIHAPSCLLLSIKAIEIQNFDGTKDAMETVSYLLMNAKVVNEMKIYYSPWSRSPKLSSEEMMRKLLSFPRGSCTCRVSFCSSSGCIFVVSEGKIERKSCEPLETGVV